mgnify:FL=1
MASFLQRMFSLSLGDVKGAFRANDTVKIEKDPNDPTKDILRFGEGKDDYFKVSGSRTGKESMREILSKVIESPTQLKKIRALPLEDRPALKMEYAGLMTGGYCNSDEICMSPMVGTGYNAASVFCHEFQHQYQFKKGKGCQRGEFKLSDKILDDRIMEAAADTARYQYLYEMQKKNPQAIVAVLESAASMEIGGFFGYALAKLNGKSETECMLEGMKSYASNYINAKMYEENYHQDVKKKDPKALDFNRYSDNVRAMVGTGYYKFKADGENLDEFEAFKAHTVGLTDEKPDEALVRKTLRSPKINFVTPNTARAITRWANHLKESGTPCAENPDKLNVKTLYGTTDNKKRGVLGGLMFKAKNKALAAVDYLKNGKDKGSLGAVFRVSDFGKKSQLILGMRKKGYAGANINFSADGKLSYADATEHLGRKEVEKRTQTAQKMFGILMKQPAFSRQVEEMYKNGVEINLSFMAVKEPRRNGNTILLNPHQKPKQLAEQFVRQFMPALREGIAAKQAEPQKAVIIEDVKPVKQETVENTPKAAEPKQEINGEALLKMVDQLAFRTSKSNQSDTYYKPTPVETKLIDSLAKYSKDMVKSAGIDSRSVQAKPFRAKCLAEWAQSPQGKSGVAKLVQAYGNMKAFEKPREKQPLMQTLQAKTAAQAQPVVKQTVVSKTQNNQR